MATLEPDLLPEILTALVAYLRRQLPVQLQPEAEDIAQEALAIAWANLRDAAVDIRDPVKYVWAVAKNKYVDLLRKQGRWKRIPLDQIVEAPIARLIEEATAEYKLMQAELEKSLRVAMKSLPERELEFLHLRFYEGLDNDAACHSLGIPPEEGSRLKFVALRRLRLLLKVRSPKQRPLPIRAVR